MKEKRLDFEILRIIAIILVVFNHTEHRGFSLYLVEGGSAFNDAISLFLAIVCKIAVPLFLLVSGGLLLHKDESVSQVLLKRVLRMAIVIVIFSGVLYFFWCRWGYETNPSFGNFFTRIWSEGLSEPYWYLYAYTALMLMLPLLRPMVRSLSNTTFVYLFVLHVLYHGLADPLGYILGIGPLNSDLALPLIEQTLFYFIMGYYLAHRFPWELMTGKKLVILVVVALLAVGIMFGFTWDDVARHGESTHFFMDNFLCFPVFAVYVFARGITVRHSITGIPARILSGLGSCVFGTYLLEGILRRELNGIYVALEPKIHVLPACFVWVVAVVVSGLVITWILKKIPGFNQLL